MIKEKQKAISKAVRAEKRDRVEKTPDESRGSERSWSNKNHLQNG